MPSSFQPADVNVSTDRTRDNVNIRAQGLCTSKNSTQGLRAHMVTALAAAGVYEISFNNGASAETVLLL